MLASEEQQNCVIQYISQPHD
eukprot:COSAG05_NODE_936_length_6533_cov_5.310227_1_plen_20_part_10